MQGDWEALAREIDSKGTASSIFADLVHRRIPSWDVTGTKITGPEDVLAFMQAVRSPYFESLKVMVLDGNDNVAFSQILHVGSLSMKTSHVPRARAGEKPNVKPPMRFFCLSSVTGFQIVLANAQG